MYIGWPAPPRQLPHCKADPTSVRMLRVLRHYLPIRKALLVFSETLLLSLAIGTGLTLHLWEPTRETYNALVIESMRPETALLRCILSSVLLAILAQVAIGFNELYDFRISSSRFTRSGRFLESAGSALGLTLLALVLVEAWDLERVLDFPGLYLTRRVQLLVFSLLFGFALLYVWRNIFHSLLSRLRLNERVLVLGSGKAAHTLAAEILERPDSGYDVVGLLRDRGPEPRGEKQVLEATSGGPSITRAGNAQNFNPQLADVGLAATDATRALIIDSKKRVAASDEAQSSTVEAGSAPEPVSEDLFELVQRERVDLVVVALQDRRRSLPTDELLKCRLAGVSVMEQEALYEKIAGKIAVEALRPSYLIFNEGFRQHPWAELLKRTVDLIAASVILALTWPLMIAAAIAIRMDSPGPILFSQERVGRDGRTFTLMKFRSMRADAEKHTGPVWASQDDPRITRCGRFLRKTRIDELPQLFNVLAGAMSLVGPRPERSHFVADLAERIPYYHQRHIVKPGLTGWAQINYPYGNTFEDSVQKLQYDLFYIKNQSLLFDLSILFNTIKTVVLRQGT